jgi:3-oxoacyl-[acyl-carrier-protein] synthase-3
MPVYPRITGVSYALPEGIVENAQIAPLSKWTAEDILRKTGIARRHIAAPKETAADLAVAAARRLLASIKDPQSIDLIAFCTQTPDYALPTSACLIQDRLGLSTSCAAFDFNLGCSGYVYGLSIVQSMLRSGDAHRALLLTGETYSKWFDVSDVSVATIFGDAGTATMLECVEADEPPIGPFSLGTDGRGASRLIVGGSGARLIEGDPLLANRPDGSCPPDRLYMDGPEVFAFTTRVVPMAVSAYLERNGLSWDSFDHVVFHQANRFMLDHLRKQCRIPAEKFVLCLEPFGNTVCNTIPVALVEMQAAGRLRAGNRLLLIGFGVGYSWGICALRWC